MNAGAYGGEMSQVLTAVTYLDETGKLTTLPAADCGFSYRHSLFSDHPDWLILEAEMELSPVTQKLSRRGWMSCPSQRRAKQPLEWPSAGSTFKRPEGHFAAALIDQCGLKGLTVGGAQVSEKHAGFLVNRGRSHGGGYGAAHRAGPGACAPRDRGGAGAGSEVFGILR